MIRETDQENNSSGLHAAVVLSWLAARIPGPPHGCTAELPGYFWATHPKGKISGLL